MHTNVILTNKRCTHAQSNYTNTKLKAWFRRHMPSGQETVGLFYSPKPTWGNQHQEINSTQRSKYVITKEYVKRVNISCITSCTVQCSNFAK